MEATTGELVRLLTAFGEYEEIDFLIFSGENFRAKMWSGEAQEGQVAFDVNQPETRLASFDVDVLYITASRNVALVYLLGIKTSLVLYSSGEVRSLVEQGVSRLCCFPRSMEIPAS
jgi:hypothetical protein